MNEQLKRDIERHVRIADLELRIHELEVRQRAALITSKEVRELASKKAELQQLRES